MFAIGAGGTGLSSGHALVEFQPSGFVQPELTQKFMQNWDLYESDFYPPEVQSTHPAMKYVGALYSLGKVSAEFYPNAGKDETVMRALERSLGTSDLEERTDLNPMLKFWGFQSYLTKDGKFAADVMPIGSIVGTAAIIEKLESDIFQIWLQELGKNGPEE